MERRRFPRQDVQGTALKAKLVLTGGSLLKKNAPAAVEIEANPINLSRSGLCVSLGLDATWETFLLKKEVELRLERGAARQSLRGRVVHLREHNHILGLEFETPLPDVSSFLLPHELQH